MIVCDVVADEPSVLDLVAFSGEMEEKTFLHIYKDIKPKELTYFHNHLKKMCECECLAGSGNFLPVEGLGRACDDILD